MSRISLYTQQISLTPWHDRKIVEELMLSPLLLGLHGNTAGFSLTHCQQMKSRRMTYPHKRASPRLLHVCAHQRHTLSQTTQLERTLLLLENWPSHSQATLWSPTGDFTPGLWTPRSSHWHAGCLHPRFAYAISQGFSLNSIKCHHNSKWTNPKVILQWTVPRGPLQS